VTSINKIGSSTISQQTQDLQQTDELAGRAVGKGHSDKDKFAEGPQSLHARRHHRPGHAHGPGRAGGHHPHTGKRGRFTDTQIAEIVAKNPHLAQIAGGADKLTAILKGNKVTIPDGGKAAKTALGLAGITMSGTPEEQAKRGRVSFDLPGVGRVSVQVVKNEVGGNTTYSSEIRLGGGHGHHRRGPGNEGVRV